MFFLLSESILTYGNLDNNTNILVYTSTPFMNKIKQSHLFNSEKINFEINDEYNSIRKACRARYNLFNLSSVKKYNKILYLDTDILVKDNIDKVFDVCREDILYVLEEGKIDDNRDFWGKSLFENEINNYNDKSAFSSGILLFNNCEKIKDLFNKTTDIFDITKFSLNDQPYLVYNAFKYNLYNNKILKKLAVNNNNIHSDKVIHHFPGGPGKYEHKIPKMTIFLNSLKDFTINNKVKKYYNSKIQIDKDVIYDVFSNFRNHTKMLVFGLGYDSRMWYEGNNKNTYFVENKREYIELNKNDIPFNNIIQYEYNTLVETSEKLTDNEIVKYKLNDKLKKLAPFDIIIIDGPEGYDNKKPGRLIPCYWSTLLSKTGTIIYIDDANRKLENYCINKYFSNKKKTEFIKREKCVKITI
jgi:lipopolysaccharide biosynthesis glycosyltransferase